MSTHLKPFRMSNGQYMAAINQGVAKTTPIYYVLAVGNSDHPMSHTVSLDMEAFQKMCRDIATYAENLNGEDLQRLINAARFLNDAIQKRQ